MTRRTVYGIKKGPEAKEDKRAEESAPETDGETGA